LAAWIWTEQRARLLTIILLIDAVGADSWRSGQLDFLQGIDNAVRYDGTTGRYTPDWANLSLPAPDSVFDRLPAAPSTERQMDVWLKMNEASGGVLTNLEPRPMGEAFTWMDLQRDSLIRAELLRFHSTGILRRGYGACIIFQASFYSRFVTCKTFFAQRGYKLYAPPTGNSQDEKIAMRLRKKLMDGIEDYIAAFPLEIKTAVDDSDGQLLKSEAARWWGKPKRRLL
jgi:hypothetical protein